MKGPLPGPAVYEDDYDTSKADYIRAKLIEELLRHPIQLAMLSAQSAEKYIDFIMLEIFQVKV